MLISENRYDIDLCTQALNIMSKIAIIGGGMAGLTAARILKDAGHEVSIFEALQGKGMDSHSLEIDGGIVDSPLRVMNPLIWQNTLALARYVGIEMFQVNTYMSCNWLENYDKKWVRTKTWLTTSRAKSIQFPLFSDWKITQQHIVSLIKGAVQYRRAVQQFFKLPDLEQQQLTLAQFMNRYAIEAKFWHGCIMPVLYTLCTCDEKTLGDWPAQPLIQFLQKMQQGSPLLRMYGGTHGLVQALSQDLTFYSGAKVIDVSCKASHVTVKNAEGICINVDKVIIATPTHVIDFLDEDTFSQELKLLRTYRFTQGELVIHTDEKCMPKNKKHWSALSYCMNTTYQQQMFSVWLNAVEPSLVGKKAIFQTWNPTIQIDDHEVIDRVKLTRAIVDQQTASTTKKLMAVQQNPNRQVYFCGSWLCDGLPILESAVTSAMFIAEQMGAVAKFKGLQPKVVAAHAL